jgi:hypothetical protein
MATRLRAGRQRNRSSFSCRSKRCFILHKLNLCQLFFEQTSPPGLMITFYSQLNWSKVEVTLRLTASQSVSLGVEPHLGLMTRYLLLFDSYGLVFVGLPLWLEDGSVFCICCWPSPGSLSRVRVPWDSWSCFTVSDLRLPFSSPPTTRRVRWRYSTPPPHGYKLVNLIVSKKNSSARTTLITPFFYCCPRVSFRRKVFTKTFLRKGLHNPVVILLRTCMLRALPSNGRSLQSHCLATGLNTTIFTAKWSYSSKHSRPSH